MERVAAIVQSVVAVPVPARVAREHELCKIIMRAPVSNAGSTVPDPAPPALVGTNLEPVMLAMWTKAQIDFAAPMVWDGVVTEDELLLVGSAVAGLCACALWFASFACRSDRSKVAVLCGGLSQAVLWTASGALLAAASQFPPWPRQHQRAEDLVSAVAAWAWTFAGALWTASAAGLLRPTAILEWVIVLLWTLALLGLSAATLMPDGHPADKWTYSSSSLWGLLGCACWTGMLCQGRSLLR